MWGRRDILAKEVSLESSSRSLFNVNASLRFGDDGDDRLSLQAESRRPHALSVSLVS